MVPPVLGLQKTNAGHKEVLFPDMVNMILGGIKLKNRRTFNE